MKFKDEPWSHYYSSRDILKMKIKRQKHGLFERQEEILETNNAECA